MQKTIAILWLMTLWLVPSWSFGGAVSHSVNDVYVLGHLAYQTDQTGTTLATFTYDSSGVPASVQVGSDPNASPRYYYVYNGHGDVAARDPAMRSDGMCGVFGTFAASSRHT